MVEPQSKPTQHSSEASVLYDCVGLTTEGHCVCVRVCVMGVDSYKEKTAGHRLVQKGKNVQKPPLVCVGEGVRRQ